MTQSPQFGLTVQVPADEWADTKRRLAFLEAVLSQILRDQSHIREWFTAAEIARLRLPGLPTTAQGIGQRANRHAWATGK